MTTELNITNALNFSIQQIFSESYWEKYIELKITFGNNPTPAQQLLLKDAAKQALLHGNSNKPIIEEGGYAKLTDTLAEEALKRYEVVSYYPNDETGFSATLLWDKTESKYTLSFRSTEYSQEADFFRDAMGADQEIFKNGFAYGQISSMEKFYAELKANVLPANTQINISGYSLGGHLANAFYVLHPNDVLKAYTQNAAGIGTIGTPGNEQKTITNYNTQLTAANLRFTNIKDDFLNTLFGNLRDSNNNIITTTINSSNYLALISGLNIDAQDNNKIVFTGSSSIQTLGNAVANFINTHSEINSADNFSYLTKFEEAIKKAVLQPNNYPTGQGNGLTIYSDERYQIAVNLTQKEFNSQRLPISPLSSNAIISQIRGRDGGSVEEAIFPSGPNGVFTTISGRATYSSQVIANDPNFVSKSNLHSAFYDVFIEDQPELVGDWGHQPVFYEWTKKNTGQYGNTHSITALIDSMRAMKTIMTLDSSITVAKAESLLSSSSNRYSPRWVDMDEDNATESNSISNFINSLYRIIKNPLATNTTFNTNYNSLGQVEQRDQLHIKENEILKHVTDNSLSINIKSFYDNSSDGILNGLANQNPFVSIVELKSKFKQNDAEGMAYRYALREMNNYVVLGANYSALNIGGVLNVGYHSDAWYDTRAEMLMQNLKNNILNSGEYSIEGTTQNGKPLQYAVIDNISTIQRDYKRLMAHGGNYVANQEFLNFGSDVAVALNPANVTPTTSYNNSVGDDKIFFSNGINYLEIVGGKDIVETGKGINVLDIKSVNYLNLNLYGNNLITLKPGIVTGEISYNNFKLQVGAKQTDGSYLDANYSNIRYKFTNYSNIFPGYNIGSTLQGQPIFQIEFTNTDNTINKTVVSGFNNTFNFLGINLPVSFASQSTSTVVTDTTANTGSINFYASNVLGTLVPPPVPAGSPPGTKYYASLPPSFYPDATVQIGNNLYFYNEVSGGAYVANINDVLNPQQYLDIKNFTEYQNVAAFPKFYRPGDKIIIPKNIDFRGLNIVRDGDDLVIDAIPRLQNQGLIGEQSRYKNYFKFDHTSNTDIFYITDFLGTAGSQMPVSEISKYLILTGTTNNDDLVSSVHNKIYGGAGGNDKLTSGSLDTTFLNYTSYNPLVNQPDINGNDVMISGSGSNRFVFIDFLDNQTGHDIIENFKTTDKIILGLSNNPIQINNDYSQNLKFTKVNNDLIIQLSSALIIQSSIRIKDYYQAFGNNPTNSGLYVEDLYGNSVPISLTEFEEKRLNTLKVDKDSPSQIVVASSSLTKTIELDTYSSDLIIEKEGTTILSSGGAYKQTITYDLTSNLAQRNNSIQNVEMSVIKLDISNNSIHQMEINNFNSEINQLEFINSDIEDFFVTRENDNLIINKLLENDVISHVVINDFFIDNFDINNLSGFTNIYIYDDVIGASLTIEDLQEMLAPEDFSYSSNNATINASTIFKNSVINSTGTGAIITGGMFNDDITAGSGDDRFIMSSGSDTYHLTSTSGIDDFIFDKDKLISGTMVKIQFDNSVAQEDISIYYDKYEKILTIKIDNDNGFIISNIEQESAYNIENFLQINLANGHNILEDNYVVESGGPLTYDGLPNNIILGTSSNNSNMNAVTSKNNLVFGGAGVDSLRGSNNVIATGNTDYKANLLVGGLGNDTIAAGSYDVVMARQGDGQDIINYTTNHDDFLISLIRNAGSTEFGLKTVGNNLEIYYGNGTTDKITINSYWTKTRDEMTLVLTDRDPLNNTHLRGYGIAEIMSEMGLTKANSASGINYIDYSDVEDILLVDDTQNLIGGEIANYYAELGTFTGLSLSTVVNTLKEFDQEILLGKSGYGDISDYRKL